MSSLYPSWLEIPVHDLNRALTFYRAVFELAETPVYADMPQTQIAVLLPSDKSVRGPGVSLVKSPDYAPCQGGVRVNFHMGGHSVLIEALSKVVAQGGKVTTKVMDEGEGVRYVIIGDTEGNTLALSSYDEV